MQGRAFKAIIAACVLAAAVMAVWAVAWIRDRGREPLAKVASPEERQTAEPSLPASRQPKAARRGLPAHLKMPKRGTDPSAAQVPTSVQTPPPRPAETRSAPRPEETALRRVLEPLVARRPSARIGFVRCLDPGGWPKHLDSETGESTDPLDVPSRDPNQAVCRAQVRARERGDLVGLLKDANGAYSGHAAVTDIRERLDAYLGRWWEADLQVDTQEPLPVQDL